MVRIFHKKFVKSRHDETKSKSYFFFRQIDYHFLVNSRNFCSNATKKVVTCFEGGGSTCCQRFSCQSFKKSPLQILSKLKLEDLQQWLDVGFICILCYDQINDHDLALKEPFFSPFSLRPCHVELICKEKFNHFQNYVYMCVLNRKDYRKSYMM